MAARLTLAAPIPVNNVRFVDCVGRVSDESDLAHPELAGNPVGELTVTLELRLTGNVPIPMTVDCRIINGLAEGIRAKGTPTSAADFAEKYATTAGVATAYTTCRAAFQATGKVGLLTQMQTLGLLPAGGIA